MKIVLTCASPKTRLEFLLGGDPIDFTGGYGGWEEVVRPRRAPVAQWVAPPARRLELSLILDGFADDSSVDGSLFSLAALASPTGITAPPTVKVAGVAIPGSGVTDWVIDGLTFQASAVNRFGERTRVNISLSLLEAVTDTLVAGKPRKRKQPPYKVKKGDSLGSIALKQLGDRKRWREILKLNKTFRPLNAHRRPGKARPRRAGDDVVVGETLKMPAR